MSASWGIWINVLSKISSMKYHGKVLYFFTQLSMLIPFLNEHGNVAIFN